MAQDFASVCLRDRTWSVREALCFDQDNLNEGHYDANANTNTECW
jgi:hypothetical protein